MLPGEIFITKFWAIYVNIPCGIKRKLLVIYLKKEEGFMGLKVKTLTVVGQDGSGKTAFIEDILFLTKSIKKFRRIDGGPPVLDTDDEEVKRNFTLTSRPVAVEHKKNKIILWDTPGFSNFLPEMRNILRCNDAVIILVDARKGFKDMLLKFWDVCLLYKKPAILFVNYLDDPEANWEKTIESIENFIGKKASIFFLPIIEGGNLTGIVNVLDEEAYYLEEKFTGKVKKGNVPVSQDLIRKLKENITETAIEVDDELTEKYLEGHKLSNEEIQKCIKKSFSQGNLIPVFCGSCYLNLGVLNLFDFVSEICPSPAECPPWQGNLDGKSVEVKMEDNERFSAYVMKTTVDHYAGKVSYLRVISGKLRPETIVVHSPSKERIKISQIFTLKGVEHLNVEEVSAGDILILKKVDILKTGDTIAEEGFLIKYPPFEIPKRVLSYVVVPKGKASEERVIGAIGKIIEEDPFLETQRDGDTKELILSGMGEVHLDVTLERLHRKFGVEIEYHLPKVPYRETIKKIAEAQGKYKKQSGGRGQYGDAIIRIEPLSRGKGFEFVDMIKGGVIPKNFIPAVEKGVREAMRSGPVAGYPVVDVRVTLFDGSFHEVDSSDIAFQIAGSLAFKNAVVKANPVLLEPIMRVEIDVPEAFVGAVMNDLNSRRGRILGIDVEKYGKKISAEVPMAELLTYAAQLRALTQGMGNFTMEFDHYEEVPPHLTSKIIENSPYKKKVEE